MSVTLVTQFDIDRVKNIESNISEWWVGWVCLGPVSDGLGGCV